LVQTPPISYPKFNQKQNEAQNKHDIIQLKIRKLISDHIRSSEELEDGNRPSAEM
jgi:hypothetical protein